MPRIIDIVRTKRNQIEVDRDEAEDLGELAVAALKAGIDDPLWTQYLARVGEFSPTQLARLLAKDSTATDTEMDKKRVYVLANATCGINSPNTTNLAVRVNTIDQGLDDCDPEP